LGTAGLYIKKEEKRLKFLRSAVLQIDVLEAIKWEGK